MSTVRSGQYGTDYGTRGGLPIEYLDDMDLKIGIRLEPTSCFGNLDHTYHVEQFARYFLSCHF